MQHSLLSTSRDIGVAIPAWGALPWERENQPPNNSVFPPRTVPLESLMNNPLVYEYFAEIEWQQARGVTALQTTPSLNPKDELESLPTAKCFYTGRRGRRKTPVHRRSMSTRSVILTTPFHDGLPLSCSYSPYYMAFTPEVAAKMQSKGHMPDHAVLATARPLRLRYGDFTPRRISLDMMLDFTLEKDIDIKELLVNPRLQCSLQSMIPYLKTGSSCEGVFSPVSPVSLEGQASTATGSQPVHPRRNRARFCPVHREVVTTSPSESRVSDDGKPAVAVWCWDKEEPLSLPGLCSCHDDDLYSLWKKELLHHHHECSSLKYQKPFTLQKVDWDAVACGDFSSFFNEIRSAALRKLHYCTSCGGLAYIPYSLIEICLNREVPTLSDLVRKLPLPVSTEVFCDGLRLTACFVARCRLHEWLIGYALRLANLDRTARAYSVCSMFVLPFQKCNDRHLPASLPPVLQCSCHNLVVGQPLRWSPADPPRFVQPHNRRPYCLLQRPIVCDVDLQGSPPQGFAAWCWSWLESQKPLSVSPTVSTPITDTEPSVRPATAPLRSLPDPHQTPQTKRTKGTS